jgi:glycosyltransferase involved in cell wall biosynthesis
MNQSIAFVTVSKGRLHHLQRTLPLIAAQAPDELVVVDYDCPDGTADWVEANIPSARVVRVNDDPQFCLPRARNLGAAASRAAWLCFIDADILVQPGFVEWLRASVQPACFYRAARVEGERDLETWGTCIVDRRSFDRLEGFDETFRGWGGEDSDLYRRLTFIGRAEAAYPARFVAPIRHADDERTRFHAVKSRELQGMINQAYVLTKYQMMVATEMRRQPSALARRQLMQLVADTLVAWDRDGRRTPPRFRFRCESVGWMPEPYGLNMALEVRVDLRSRPSAE